jgi:hypothetical protein
LAQIILRGKESMLLQIKDITFLQGEIIAKEKKYTEIKKKSSPEPVGQMQSNLVQIILW